MRTLHLILMSLGCFLLTVSCKRQGLPEKQIQSVKVDTVIANSEKSFIQYPGRVKAAQDVDLSFKVSGTLQQVFVKEGSFVKTGQLLAEMDPSDYQVQLDATEAKYKEVKAEADRVIALYEEGGTTPNNYDKAVYGLQQITALYQHHKDELAYTKLYAPFDGYVQKRLFEAHETLAAGMPVISMIGKGAPEVEINLPAAEYIRKGYFKGYHCTFDVYPGKKYPLKFVGVSPKANANQLYTLCLQIVTAGLPVPSPGMNTMVSIYYSDDNDNQMQVPSGALLQKKGRTEVFVYNSKTEKVSLCEVDVVRLLSDGDCVITAKDLKPGDIVVSAGVHYLTDGEKVKLVAPVSATNIGGML